MVKGRVPTQMGPCVHSTDRIPDCQVPGPRVGPWPRVCVEHQPCGLHLWEGTRHLQAAAAVHLHPALLPVAPDEDPKFSLLPQASRGSPHPLWVEETSASLTRGSGLTLRAGLWDQADLGFRSLG